MVLLYTDGVTETAGPEERFGSQRLRALLARHSSASPGEFLHALEVELERFRAHEAADDVAALALRPVAGS
jgi:serine phosphatase RsbU (regulator of sigma subunit)